MLKIALGPLDAETVQVIARRRGIEVNDLVSSLIQREAAIEITNWRSPVNDFSTPADVSAATLASAAQGAQRDAR